MPRRGLVAALAAAALFAAATPWALRPWFLARDAFPHAEGGAGAMADADLYLNVWILAWVAHAAVTEPARLFDGNIFYPAQNTITGSENMLAHLPVTAPVLAATGNALHVLKAMVLESFVLAGLAMFLFVHHHTRDPVAALLAGAAYTFTPLRVQVIPEPQYLGTQYLPLALLAIDLWITRRARAALVGLAAALALQLLACVYVGYFTLATVPVYAAARLAARGTSRRAEAAGGLLLAAGAALLVVFPTALPYLRARAAGIIPVQDLRLVTAYSWPPWVYVTPAVFHKIGLVPALMVAADLVGRVLTRWRRRPAGSASAPEGAAWLLAGIAVLLSAGPYLALPGGTSLPLPYLLLYHLVPGFSAIRAPVRFFVVVGAALSALAGFGFARWSASWPSALRLGAGVALAAACVATAAPRPAAVMPAHLGAETPEVYRWLAERAREGAIVEVPGWHIEGDIVGNLRNGRYMVASTVHWQSLVNGYTAYPPLTAGFLAAAIRRLPAPEALAVLVDSVDVRWLVLHRDELSPFERAPWNAVTTPGLSLAVRFGSDEVYAVTRAPSRPWRAELLARAATPPPDTLMGTPRAPLAPDCRKVGRLDVVAPPILFPAPVPLPVGVRFTNDSACRWPAVDVRPAGLVGLTYRWQAPSGRLHPGGPFSRLLHDIEPGEAVDETMMVFPPGGEHGRWELEVMLVQHGEAVALARTRTAVEVRPWREPVSPR